MFRVCHAFLPVHCSLVVTCWERANLLALLYVMFSCVFATFLCGVLGQVWYLIVSIPDLCFLTYFKYHWLEKMHFLSHSPIEDELLAIARNFYLYLAK